MPEPADRIIAYFPRAIIVFAIEFGLILLFLSPIRFFVKDWVVFPLSASTPLDALSTFAVIILIALVLGIPSSIFEGLVVADDGLNHKLKRLFKKDKSTEKSLNKKKGSSAEFDAWLHDKGFSTHVDYLVLLNSMVNGLLIGSEIAVVLNILYFPIFSILLFLHWVKDNGILGNFQLPVLIFVFSLLIFILTYFFNDKKWKHGLGSEFSNLEKDFQEEWLQKNEMRK